jgi:hypothetical protein
MKQIHVFGMSFLALGLAFAQSAQEQDSSGLSASTAVARVLDREGRAARRPVLASRWSSVKAGMALAVGDWLEVPSRGANA